MDFNRLLCLLILKLLLAQVQSDPAGNQLSLFKNETCCGSIGIMTTSAGMPIDYNEVSTLNTNLITHSFFIDTLSHFVRERIPERVVHPKGAGAFGYFEVTDEVTDISKARFLSKVGKRTKIATRFSLLNEDKGGSDTAIEGRGFAIKFYTEEGNFDLVGLNIETFFTRDPNNFVPLARVLKRNPVTNFKDPTMTWDLITLHPETLNTFLFLNIMNPDGYQHMRGFGIHTFQLENKNGNIHFVRFHLIPNQGIKNLTVAEATKIASEDADYNSRKLYNAIANSNYPSWTVSIQVANMSDVNNTKIDVHDVTKRLPIKDFPLRRIGKIVLNKNPNNYHADVELLAFNPGHLVPGINAPVDRIFLGRLLAYNNAAFHRAGSNFNKIPVNRPLKKALTYVRNGNPPVNDNMGGAPNYFPNSFNGPEPCTEKKKNKKSLTQYHEEQSNNMEQTRDFYLNEITEDERQIIINFVVNSLSSVPKVIQNRALYWFSLIDQKLRDKVAKGLQEIRNRNYV